MMAVVITPDLLIASRLMALLEQAGQQVDRIDEPGRLAGRSDIDLVLVDWSARTPAWAEQLRAWNTSQTAADRSRLLLFGPHTDRAAHEAARRAGLGPMWARSKLLLELPRLIDADRGPEGRPSPPAREGAGLTR